MFGLARSRLRFCRAIAVLTIAIGWSMFSWSQAVAGGQPQAGETAISDPAALQAILGGHTIIGYFETPEGGHDNWTEYHCPNGQSRYIHDGELMKGLWRLRDGHVCYSYDRPDPGETFCFDVYADQGNGYKLILVGEEEEGFVVFISQRLSGDPFKILKLDGGSCEDLSS